MAKSMQASWRRIGLGAAFVTALLPVLVALLHLLPPAVHAAPNAHHQHASHAALVYDHPSAAEYQTPPDAPRHGDSRSSVGHCPLCFWLQGFHALPAPDVVAATPLPSGTARALPWHEPDFVLVRLSGATQPRAPPISLPVA